MDIQKADLFKGLGTNLVKEIMDVATKASYGAGEFLFHKGDPADHLFILRDGTVKLRLGESGKVVHTVSRPGQAFGWSSLVERRTYSASAECIAPSTVYRFRVQALAGKLEEDPANGVVFYKRLAGLLGERLLDSYGRYEKKFAGETRI